MRSDAYVEVSCNNPKCLTFETYELTATANGWNAQDLEKQLKGDGWIIIGDEDYCSLECAYATGAIVN